MTALDKSIEKWRLICWNQGVDDGSNNCALCEKHISEKDYILCKGCPISETVGRLECRGTPYIEWVRHHLSIHLTKQYPFKIHIGCKECSRLAFKQYRFMRSLKN